MFEIHCSENHGVWTHKRLNVRKILNHHRVTGTHTVLLRAFLVAAGVGWATVVDAQTAPSSPAPVAATVAASVVPVPAFDGPSAPVAPATINRDAAGRATVRAVRLTSPLQIDGKLTEPIYQTLAPIGDFIQVEPTPGAEANEKSEIWITFDKDRLYLSARLYDTDPEGIVATELRRDNTTIYSGNDVIGFALDTFYDRRSSFAFFTTPAGARMEGQTSNERQWNGDWNPVWEVKVDRFGGGWTVEVAVPFKSLRYRPGEGQVWGFNAIRAKRSTNEISSLTKLPPARGINAFQQMSLAATLVGLEPPSNSRPIDLKPYVTSSLLSDVNARPRPLSNAHDANIGLDAKYAFTEGLTGDFTVNTDFAQVEADEQQVNLTRFSLFFPEKRDFFLENQGTFSFGGVSASTTGGDAPVLFYSRRVGLNGGRLVPLRGGGRVTGRAGKFSIGVLDIQTGREEISNTRPTNFSVVRLKRDILRRSAVGLLATGRSIAASGSGNNVLFGADGTFGFFQNLIVNTYWARTQTDGVRGDDRSYRGQLDYTADRYTLQLERLAIGDHFNPETGFVRRDDMRKNAALFKFSPRLSGSKIIRKLNYQGSLNYVENGRGHLESREQAAEFAINFVNNDILAVNAARTYEFLPQPFAIARGVTLPVGGYAFDNIKINYNMSQQRPRAANITVERGTFYNGRKMTLSIARGRAQVTPRLSMEPTYSFNKVSLVQGRFTTHLAGSRVTFAMTPLMFASALVQYSSSADTVSVNARLRWEYHPGSELFVVYNEERDTLRPSVPGMLNRAFIVKINRLFRF
ncbi:MAG: DUF5916 domain-containing protein [Vicinamibacterales bacterium]